MNVLKEVAKVNNSRIPLPDNLFQVTNGLITSLKSVKGSSKVMDFNMCACYYYALHTSIYIYIYTSQISNWYTPDSVLLNSFSGATHL